MITQKDFEEKFGQRMRNIEGLIKNCSTLREIRAMKVLVTQLEKDVEKFETGA